MSRYIKYSRLINGYYSSKQNVYSLSQLPRINKLTLVAGHYKFNNLLVEHGLIFLALTGNTPELSLFSHGKRLKKTLTLQTSFFNNKGLSFTDKLVNFIIPNMEDFTAFKHTRALNKLYYEWRIRCYFEDLSSNSFISERLARQSVFMPLFFSVVFYKNFTHQAGRVYLRMLRLPLLNKHVSISV